MLASFGEDLLIAARLLVRMVKSEHPTRLSIVRIVNTWGHDVDATPEEIMAIYRIQRYIEEVDGQTESSR
jgi:hypothetical protein